MEFHAGLWILLEKKKKKPVGIRGKEAAVSNNSEVLPQAHLLVKKWQGGHFFSKPHSGVKRYYCVFSCIAT
jgi:hypothetical protein